MGREWGMTERFPVRFKLITFQCKSSYAETCYSLWTFLFHSATGREVFDWILDQGYYSERDTSNVVRQVLEAVAYLHSLHIVHRNLKVTSYSSAGLVRRSKQDISLLKIQLVNFIIITFRQNC